MYCIPCDNKVLMHAIENPTQNMYQVQYQTPWQQNGYSYPSTQQYYEQQYQSPQGNSRLFPILRYNQTNFEKIPLFTPL